MAQKIKPADNTMDMDFLEDFGSTVSSSQNTVLDNPVTLPPTPSTVTASSPATAATIIDPVSMEMKQEGEVDDDGVKVIYSKSIKPIQIVVRSNERERDAMKAYFMKHGISLSKGIKIAVKYLEEQEKKGLVRFSDVGLY